MSSIVNKIKEVVSEHKHSDREGAHGSHSSRVANAADPRVDSNRDSSHTVGSTTGTTGTTGQYSPSDNYTYGASGNQFASGDGPAPNTAGPHQRDILNKADPRVDSDRDGSRTIGGGTTGTTGYTSTTGTGGAGFGGARGSDTFGTTTGAGTTGTTGTFTSQPEGTMGPHSSRLANAADPRVDSDLDGSRTLGSDNNQGDFGTRTAGTGLQDTTGQFGSMGDTYGTGAAPTTAGPHGRSHLGKADPRMGSDLGGGTTLGGGNETFSQS